MPDFVRLDSDSYSRLVISSISALGRAALLARAAPESRFILMLRHPWGQIESVLRGASHGQQGWLSPDMIATLAGTTQARRRGLSADKLAESPSMVQLAWQWVILNEFAHEQLSAAAPHFRLARLFEVNHDPWTHGPQLFAFCGVPWGEQTIEFVRWSTQGTGKEGYYDMRRDPTDATWGWRRRMTPAEIDSISEVVFDSALGRMFDVEPPRAK